MLQTAILMAAGRSSVGNRLFGWCSAGTPHAIWTVPAYDAVLPPEHDGCERTQKRQRRCWCAFSSNSHTGCLIVVKSLSAKVKDTDIDSIVEAVSAQYKVLHLLKQMQHQKSSANLAVHQDIAGFP